MKLYSLMSARFSIVILFVLISLALPLVASAQGKIAFTSNRDGNNEIYVMNSDGTGQNRLTVDSSVDELPTFSPGGARIAFVSNRDGNYEIYVMNSNGMGQTRLTNNSAFDSEPSFSPDGTKILFSSDRDGNHEIYIMNQDGSGQTRLTNGSDVDTQAAFSSDGAKIVFNRGFNIWVMNSDGSNQTQLVFEPNLDLDPSFSPDGSKILFWANRVLPTTTDEDVYLMNADGSNEQRLTLTAGRDGYPVFSPDGTKIAFFSVRDGDSEIYVMNAQGGSPQRLTFSVGTDWQPAWTDATQFPPELSDIAAIGANEGGTITLSGSILSPDPSLPLTLTVNWGDGSQQDFNYPAGTLSFSETHQYLDNPIFDPVLFNISLSLTTANGTDLESTVVHVFNVAPSLFVSQPLPVVIGSPLTVGGTVTDPGILDTHTVQINWGDGSPTTTLNLAAGVSNYSANHAYATTGAYSITVSASDDDGGSATPQNIIVGVVPPATSGKIAFTSTFAGNNNVYLMNSNGTNPVALTTHPASDSYPNISRDGSKIVFVSDRDGNPEIYVMNAAGLFQTRLTNNAATESEPVFSPDGSKIVFSSNRDGNHEIYIMNADGTGQSRLTTNTGDDGQAEFSPDGTKIIFARLATNQSDAHIFTMDLTGANQVPLTTGSFVLNGYASYSPDGTKIVFSRANLSHTNAEIYIMDANGANAVRLTTAAGQDLEAAFSPNGSKIAFRSERDGNAEIYIMDPNGANQQRITFDGAGVSNFAPSWAEVPVLTVDIPDDLGTSTGSTLTVPITVTNTSGSGIFSYDFTVTYDPLLLQPQTPASDNAGTLSSGFEINAGASTPGRLVVSAFGTTPLSGAGTLLNLKFDVVGEAPAFAELGFLAFKFNEGVPLVEVSGGQAFISGTVSGRVSYGVSAGEVGVPGVNLQATGSPITSTSTGADGTYLLQGFGPGSYTVTPSKVGDVNGIAAFDASLISRFLVGAAALSANQQIAADVTEAGGISSFDAAMIARYVVGLPDTANVGLWRFAPPSRNYPSVATLTGEDYSAVLLGEISGDWTPPGQFQANAFSADAGLEREVAGSKGGGRKERLEISIGSLKAVPGQSLVVPVSLEFPAGTPDIRAYQFDVVFDPKVLVPEGSGVDTGGTLSSSFSAVTNPATPGRIRIAVFGSGSIVGSGTMLNLRFTVIGAKNSSSAITLEKPLLNEGNPAATVRNGRVSIGRVTL